MAEDLDFTKLGMEAGKEERERERERETETERTRVRVFRREKP
jgi:hypothetical protein